MDVALPVIFSVIGMVALVKKAGDLVRYARARDWNALAMMGLTAGLGVGAAFLFAHSSIASDVDVAGHPLGSLNASDLVILGVTVGFVAAYGTDWLAGIDNTRSSRVPPLVSEPLAPVVPPPKSDL